MVGTLLCRALLFASLTTSSAIRVQIRRPCSTMPTSHMQQLLKLRGGLNPVALVATQYSAAMAAAPVATNVATAGVLSLCADGIAQKLTSSDGTDWDWARSAWIIVWGSIVNGYLMGKWFGFLGQRFPGARTSWKTFALKLATNQAVLSPSLNAGFFAFVVLTRTPPIALMSVPTGFGPSRDP